MRTGYKSFFEGNVFSSDYKDLYSSWMSRYRLYNKECFRLFQIQDIVLLVY